MKTYPPLERPPVIGLNPEPLELAHFILWQFLQMPANGLYAKWDPINRSAVWFCSSDRDFMFRQPGRDTVLYEERSRLRFRSVLFRLGSLGDDGLCGHFEFQNSSSIARRYTVHASFDPDSGIGLWIAITVRDEAIDLKPRMDTDGHG